MTNAETQLAGLFSSYPPAIAKLGKGLHERLRARLSGLNEIVYVYERQRSVVISYSPTEKGYEGVCSLALDPQRAKLHFSRGPELARSAPSGLLQGSAKTVRYVVLSSVQDLGRPEIEALLAAALKLAKVEPVAGGKGKLVVKAKEQHKRAARAKKTSRSAAASKPTKARR